MDGNFRLRNALVSTPEHDPPLRDGHGYFITQRPY